MCMSERERERERFLYERVLRKTVEFSGAKAWLAKKKKKNVSTTK